LIIEPSIVLFPQPQPLNDSLVASRVFAFKVFLVMPALTYQLEQATPGAIITFVILEMLLKLVNAKGQ